MRQQVILALLFTVIIGSLKPAQAMVQAEIELLGVSQDLTQLGTIETWTDTSPHCRVQIYHRDQWEPILTQEFPGTQCKQSAADLTEQYHLQKIKWTLAQMPQPAPKIKDDDDNLIPGLNNLKTHYPLTQQYDFELRDSDKWQVFVQTPKNPLEASATPYTFILRPSLEPIPYITIHSTYQAPEVLVTPIKIMLSEFYGITVVMFRDTTLGKTDLDYHYRPFFIKWPNYQPMTVEEARQELTKASEYAMEPNLLVKGPNTLQPPYRAYLRLKTAHLPLDDLKASLQEASPAGKLYWLLLIADQNPVTAKHLREDLIEDPQSSESVIQVTGEQWQSVSFKSLLQAEANKEN